MANHIPIDEASSNRAAGGKNRQRHLTCLTKYRPLLLSRNGASKMSRKETENGDKVTIDTDGLKRLWENKVFAQLSNETVVFIKDRFKELKPVKETSRDFSESRNADTDHSNISTFKRKRLFDLWYGDSKEPDQIVLL